MKLKIIFIIFIALIQHAVYPDNWDFEYEKENIKVYTKKIKESNFKEYMGIGIVDSNIWTIIALMNDIDSYPQWNGNCIHAEIITPKKNNTMIQYFINSAPWPVKGRDVILKTIDNLDLSNMKKDNNNGVFFEIIIISVKEPLVPVTKDYVRITDLEGKWIIEGLKNNKTRITYIIKADIAGKVSDNISNMVSKDLPFKTIKSIREMVKLNKYIDEGIKILNQIKNIN